MKRALVTGASSGLGQRVIREFLEDGWWVVCVSQQMPTMIPNLDQYHYHETDNDGTSTSKPRFHWHAMDLSDTRYTYGLVNAIRNEPIDLLVHCSLPTLLGVVVSELEGYVKPMDVLFGETWLAKRGASCQV